MIHPEKAIQLILSRIPAQARVRLALEEAAGLYAACDIPAPYDHPFFDQSAMDGYAIRFDDLKERNEFVVVGESSAGTMQIPGIKKGECLRIFTGAPLPESADTVVMQENVKRSARKIVLQQVPEKKGLHVRQRGEQIRKGDIAFRQGKRFNPAAIGFLASIGVAHVDVHARPRVSIIATGSEFLEEGAPLQRGKIFESNSVMLRMALQREGLDAKTMKVRDDEELLSSRVKLEAAKSDLLLLSGGVSVGDYDFTPGALERAGFQMIFHKVSQKPGKPLLFALRDDCVAFGLPGNPRSVLNSFYLYVLPALQKMLGAAEPGLLQSVLPLAEKVKKRGDRTWYLSGKVKEGRAVPLDGQGSHMLQSFSEASIIIKIPHDKNEVQAGEEVEVYFIPQ